MQPNETVPAYRVMGKDYASLFESSSVSETVS
jgi:hypothetical protein